MLLFRGEEQKIMRKTSTWSNKHFSLSLLFPFSPLLMLFLSKEISIYHNDISAMKETGCVRARDADDDADGAIVICVAF